ncbi:MAG: hypothetical protein R3F54_15970 [Alphaproteobacteria bacterium]
MFEPVNDLARRLPHPRLTGDPLEDWHVIEQHVANGRRLRSEAFACMLRSVGAWFRGRAQRPAGSFGGNPSPQH